jgi:hypothetical protein
MEEVKMVERKESREWKGWRYYEGLDGECLRVEVDK